MIRLPWTPLASEVKFASQWFEVYRDDMVRPDGSRGFYDRVVAPPAVTVLVSDEQRRIAVTKQWICVHEESQWRLPAGRVEEVDIDPEMAARRELAEETGVRAADWLPLGTINCADSLTNHRDHAFFVTTITERGEPCLEPGEADLQVHWLPADQVVDMVLTGKMPHAGSAFAVLTAKVQGLL